jgi:hypothetical protein
VRLVAAVALFVAGGAVALAAEAWWRHDGVLGWSRAGSSSPSGAAPSLPSLSPASRAAIAAAVERCRDDCEQWAIVAQAGDASLRTCRAACDRTAPAAAPREPIRSVTRAPADHRAQP